MKLFTRKPFSGKKKKTIHEELDQQQNKTNNTKINKRIKDLRLIYYQEISFTML